MTEKKEATKQVKETTKEPKKSQRLISFKEYFLGKDVREETKARIKIQLKGSLYRSQEEWDKILAQTLNK